jgi:hypothetical protein
LQAPLIETLIIIHGQRNKRNRRLSSIVGVKTNPYERDYEVEELIESKKADIAHQEPRKISLDYFQYENAQDPAFNDSGRKYSVNGNYFNYNSGAISGDKSINSNPFYRSGME